MTPEERANEVERTIRHLTYKQSAEYIATAIREAVSCAVATSDTTAALQASYDDGFKDGEIFILDSMASMVEQVRQSIAFPPIAPTRLPPTPLGAQSTTADTESSSNSPSTEPATCKPSGPEASAPDVPRWEIPSSWPGYYSRL